MDNIAIVIGHIWEDDMLGKNIEIISMVHNDDKGTDIFCVVEDALLDNIDTGDEEDYDFIAIVKATHIKVEYWEYTEWDVEYEVIEVDSLQEALDMYNKEVRGVEN